MGLSAARMVTLSKLRKNYSVSMQDSSKVREVYEHILEMRGRSKNEIASKVSELDVWAQNQLKKEGGKQ